MICEDPTPPLNSELSPPAEPPVSLSAAVPLSRKLEDPRIVTQLLYIVYCQDDSSAPPAPYLDFPIPHIFCSQPQQPASQMESFYQSLNRKQ